MNDYLDEKPKRGRIPWKLIIILGIVGILIGAYVIYRAVLNRRVQKQLNAIRAQGYPVTLDELAAWYPEPQGENAAYLFERAFSKYQNQPGDWSELPVAGEGELPEHGEPLPEDMKQTIADYLELNAEALKQLHIAAGVDECRYSLNFRDGYDMRWPHMAPLRQACRLLYLEAILSAETGDTEQAAKAILSSLGTARSLRNEPTLVSQFVYVALEAITCGSLERVLNRAVFSDAQLVRLQESFEEAHNPESFLRVMAGERCFGTQTFKGQTLPSFLPKTQSRVALEIHRASGYLAIDFHNYLEIMNGLVDIAQMPSPDRLEAAAVIEKKIEDLPQKYYMAPELLAGVFSAVNKDLRNTARLQTAVAALAVERYRLAEGKLPNGLEDLVPKYLDEVPNDPFDGNPLRYRQLDRGYLIYSINSDGEDNDGIAREEIDPKDMWERNWDIPFRVER